MQNNEYLGNCLAVVHGVNADEMERDGLQSPFILLLICSRLDVNQIRSPSDLVHASLFDPHSPILLRIASECLLGTFGDSHCDCEPQRVAALREIDHVGQGVYVHLPQEAQGHGLFYKAKELEVQVAGVDPQGRFIGQKNIAEAAAYLLGENVELDRRRYTSLKKVFSSTGLDRYSYALISDSPAKADFLAIELGISVDSLHEAKRPVTVDNAGEYLAKLYKKNYALTNRELEEIYRSLFSAPEIPIRVLTLLYQLQEDMVSEREFRADSDLLSAIVHIPERRALPKPPGQMDLLKDAEAYEEYQIEVSISGTELDQIFAAGVLKAIESLRYEENHFYDLVPFKEVPARSLKIREAYRLSDLKGITDRSSIHPIETKLIYKLRSFTTVKTLRPGGI